MMCLSFSHHFRLRWIVSLVNDEKKKKKKERTNSNMMQCIKSKNAVYFTLPVSFPRNNISKCRNLSSDLSESVFREMTSDMTF